MSVEKHAMKTDDSHLEGAGGVDAKGKTSATGKGCITKCLTGGGSANTFNTKDHGHYRRNGYEFVKGNAAKNGFLLGTYKGGYLAASKAPASWTEKGYGQTVTVRNPEKKPGAFAFSGDNYKGANDPFVNNAHHIMPWSSLRGSLDNEMGILLQKSGYNLNAGDNLIFLPKRQPTALVIGCYTHPSNHKDYSDECQTAVERVVGEIEDYIGENTEDHEINDSNVGMLKDSLEGWQDTEYGAIVQAGRAAAGEDIKNHVPSPIKMVVRSGAGS
jgi:hypothetical protein